MRLVCPHGSAPSRAFTLLELLVVVGVIVCIAALLFSAVSGVQGAGKRTACLNNLRQVALALRFYAADHADVLPLLPIPNPYPNGIGCFYKELVKSYVGLHGPASPGEKVFVCPADRAVFKDSTHAFTSYTFNGFERVGPYYVTPERGYRLEAVSRPVESVLVGEFTAFFGNSWHARRAKPHNRAMNTVAFVDGHAAYLPFYWNGNQEPRWYEPIAGFDYTWRLN